MKVSELFEASSSDKDKFDKQPKVKFKDVPLNHAFSANKWGHKRTVKFVKRDHNTATDHDTYETHGHTAGWNGRTQFGLRDQVIHHGPAETKAKESDIKIKLDQLEDGSFKLSSEKSGPSLKALSYVMYTIVGNRNYKVKTASGKELDRMRGTNKLNSFYVTCLKPEGAEEKLKTLIDQKIKTVKKEIASSATRNTEPRQRPTGPTNQQKLITKYGKEAVSCVKYRKYGGDDLYSWAVFRDGRVMTDGCSQGYAKAAAEDLMDSIAIQNRTGIYKDPKEYLACTLGLHTPLTKEIVIKTILERYRNHAPTLHMREYIKDAKAAGFDGPELDVIEKSVNSKS